MALLTQMLICWVLYVGQMSVCVNSSSLLQGMYVDHAAFSMEQ